MANRSGEPVAIVTGGAKGIGRAICIALARDGARVVVADIDIDYAHRTACEVGPLAMAVQLDVSSEDSVRAAYSLVRDRLGRVDILVSNAGIFDATDPLEITCQEWNRVMGVNALGTFLMCREALPSMKEAGCGRIVNIASTAGKTGGAARAGVHYAASKAAVICMTKSLARYAASFKVNVNAVCPGPTETDLTQAWGEETNADIAKQIPWQELGKPADVAEAVAFLASDKARYITGEILNVSGGLVMD
jgi:NAD(P)-dependent dehydrogenase (short-subunit alcohol dehydrogenase family)